jgi:hypothetical protein
MNIITHSTEAFTWNGKTKHFVAERSDFTGKGPWTIVKEGNYETPYCSLRNPRTGNSVLFVFLHTRESDGPDYEIEAWVFGPSPEECEKNPRLFGVEIHFLND